jgi:hypothetical protein
MGFNSGLKRLKIFDDGLIRPDSTCKRNLTMEISEPRMFYGVAPPTIANNIKNTTVTAIGYSSFPERCCGKSIFYDLALCRYVNTSGRLVRL